MEQNIAIGWVQYKLAGGRRSMIFAASVYSSVAIAVMAFCTQMAVRPSLAELGRYVPLFTVIQMIVLLLWGTVRVGTAVRNDITFGMIESHRLMPLPATSAILGYLFGSTVQVFTVFAINIALGAVCVSEANVPQRLWLVANGLMLLYALMIWTIVIYFSFRFPGAAYLMIALQLALLIAQSARTVLLPGVNMLAAPMFTDMLMRLGRFDAVRMTLAASCALQAVVTVFFVIAAGNRYLRDNAGGFGFLLSLLVLVLWIIACFAGILLPPLQIRQFPVISDTSYEITAFTMSVITTGLLATLPIMAAVHARKSPMLATFLVFALCSVMFFVAPRSKDHHTIRVVEAAVELFAFILCMHYMIGLAAARKLPSLVLIGIWLFALWIVPTLVDTAIAMNTPYSPHHRDTLTWSAVISLPASIAACWNASTSPLGREGLGTPIMQLLFAGVAAMIFHAFRRAPAAAKARPADNPALKPSASLIAN